jgi:hypothetical protein
MNKFILMICEKVNNLFNQFDLYRLDLMFCRGGAIKIFNFWPLKKPSDLWFFQFIEKRDILINSKKLSIYSVFGDRLKMRFDIGRPKIFFTGENVTNRPMYLDHCLNSVDLSLGFEYLDHPNYFRFPLWYLYFIKPHWGLLEIKDWIVKIETKAHQRSYFSREFCAMVAGHDPSNTRSVAFDTVSKLGKVDSGGRFLNNTTKLLLDYGNDKIRFLENYKYVIALENSDTNGYVTEKIFDAYLAGCIPIYWGSNNSPEPEILNQDRILFLNPDNPSNLESQLSELCNDKNLEEFYLKPIFRVDAAEIIYDRLLKLETRIKNIV